MTIKSNNAFCQTHKRGYPTTIVIASDTPHITHKMIVQAQEALQEVNVVLGPADDGGYYLIAMREPHDVFSRIPMSNSMVAVRTIARARAQGLIPIRVQRDNFPMRDNQARLPLGNLYHGTQVGMTVRLIEPLFDIDEHADLLRLVQLLKMNSVLAPTTAALIASLAQYVH